MALGHELKKLEKRRNSCKQSINAQAQRKYVLIHPKVSRKRAKNKKIDTSLSR